MVGKKDLAFIALAAFCLAATLLVATPIRSSPNTSNYNPWADLNNDGTVDILDAIMLASAFDSSGTPLTKAATLYDSGWINITDKCGHSITIDHNLQSTDIRVDVTGKTSINGGTHQKYFGLTDYASGWTKTYGSEWSTRGSEARSIIRTSDGGYAVAGRGTWSTFGYPDAYVVKIDASGNLQWNYSYLPGKRGFAHSIIQTADGGYALAGTATLPSGTQGATFWLCKIDAYGNYTWSKSDEYWRGVYSSDEAFSLVQTSDGYALAGTINTDGNYDGWLLKTDGSGNEQWNKTFGGEGDDEFYSLLQTSDGGYVMTGVTSSIGTGDAWLIKTDGVGNTVWSQTFGSGSGRSVIQTSEGDYAIAGATSVFGAGSDDLWLIKTDSAGDVLWNKTYGGAASDVAYSVVQTNERGYALAGCTNSFGAGNSDFWLVKTDAGGNMQWNKTYGGTKDEFAYSLVQAVDGGYVMAGYTWSYASPYSGFWVVKTDVESGLAWVDSGPDNITLYRGATDAYWNFVRVQVWAIGTPPSHAP